MLLILKAPKTQLMQLFGLVWPISDTINMVKGPGVNLTHTVLPECILTLKIPAGAIFARIQSQIDAADNSYCQETSLTGIRPVM